jgi:prolyl-tRNA synthetase
MAHSDDKGLVVPPKLAPTEVVIVPIFKNATKLEVMEYAGQLHKELKESFSVVLDEDEQNSPGWKFAEWEMPGVPLRIEIGPRDMEQGKVVIARRDTGEKTAVTKEEVPSTVKRLLEEIQENLFNRALKFREDNTNTIDDYPSFIEYFEKESGFADSLWCGSPECEEKAKEDTKATIRVLPFDQENRAGSFVVCGGKAKYRAVFGKAY